MTRIPLILSLLALLPASALAQNTWFVPDDFLTIQLGIDGSTNGDTVIVRDGTYVENINFNGKAITLKSKYGPATTIIDGNQNGSVVTFDNGENSNSVFEGFTVTNGNAADGGGMYCETASPTLNNCTFTNNTANYNGGGMSCYESSSPTLDNCTFTGNWAGYEGGGMYCGESSSSTLDNCTFTDNTASYNGGGMCCETASPTLNNCTFTNNTASKNSGGMHCYRSSSPTLDSCAFTGNTASFEGGGMFCNSSSPNLDNCTFTNNTAFNGGGMHCGYSSSPTLDNCTFTNNTANGYDGGGMSCFSSSPTLTDCTFTDNTTNYAGGGMSCRDYSSPTLDNCTFADNTSTYGSGGGMLCDYSSPTLDNCTFTNNTAINDGGGMSCLASSPTLDNCTFTNNTASNGGGMSCFFSSSPTLTNCILWDNHANSGLEIGEDASSTTTVIYSDVKGGWSGTGNIDADPLFVDPVNGDFHLRAGSPCIDTGNPNSSLDPDGTRADMGAFYFDQSGTIPHLTVTNLVAGQTALVEVTNATPNNFSHFAWSVHGGGPTPTPWGDAMVTPPYHLKLLPTDSTGYASYTANIPLHAVGVTVWCHGTDAGTQSMLNALMLVIQ